jgi:hypothetical protein
MFKPCNNANTGGLWNAGKKRPKFTVMCNHNECVFLKDVTSKRQANREATSHLNSCQHDVSILTR